MSFSHRLFITAIGICLYSNEPRFAAALIAFTHTNIFRSAANTHAFLLSVTPRLLIYFISHSHVGRAGEMIMAPIIDVMRAAAGFAPGEWTGFGTFTAHEPPRHFTAYSRIQRPLTIYGRCMPRVMMWALSAKMPSAAAA